MYVVYYCNINVLHKCYITADWVITYYFLPDFKMREFSRGRLLWGLNHLNIVNASRSGGNFHKFTIAFIWANSSDLSRGHPKCLFGKSFFPPPQIRLVQVQEL